MFLKELVSSKKVTHGGTQTHKHTNTVPKPNQTTKGKQASMKKQVHKPGAILRVFSEDRDDKLSL